MIRNLLSGVIGLVYPPKCVFCGQLLSVNEIFCQSCVTHRNPSTCPLCYKAYKNCICQHSFETVLAPFEYSGNVKKAILRLKNRQDTPTIKCFAAEMAEVFKSNYNNLENLLLVPVPINQKTKKARGYNQSQALAEAIGKILGIRVNSRLLARAENSLPQHSLKRDQRWANAESSFFSAKTIDLTDKSIVLVDDVATTGATLCACSNELIKLGAKKIVALCASST